MFLNLQHHVVVDEKFRVKAIFHKNGQPLINEEEEEENEAYEIGSIKCRVCKLVLFIPSLPPALSYS